MSKHLEFFTDLVFNREDLNLDKDFLGNEELKAKGFVLVPFGEEQVYWSSEMAQDNNVEPVFKDVFISKNTFVSNKLRLHKRELVNYLIQLCHDVDSNEKILSELETLKEVYKLLLKGEYTYSETIKDVIKELVSELSLYINDNIVIAEKLKDIIRVSKYNSFTYFKVKSGIKSSFIYKLQMVCSDLVLINDEEVSEDDFYNVFTSNKIDDDTHLKFEVDNVTIAVFFDEIAPFYDGLTFTQIEKCGMFFNKQGKPIKATDLYAAKSRIDTTNNILIKNLQEEILELKSEYLN